MPRPKKAEKTKKEEKVLDLRQDREEFLRVFEKPTQIYRFLRARQCISPVFLQRTLSYLQNRCSRTNARRKVFHIDDMWKMCEFKNATSTGSQLQHFDQLKISIVGFYMDPGIHSGNRFSKKSFMPLIHNGEKILACFAEIAFHTVRKPTKLSSIEAEISVRKTLRCRRKDGETLQMEEVIDAVEVPVNPRNPDNYEEEPIFLSTSDVNQPKDGQSVKNYSLVFRMYEPHDYSDMDTDSSDNELSEDDMILDDQGDRKKKQKDDPAGISLRNLTTGSRCRKINKEDSKESDSDDCRSVEKQESSAPLRKFKKPPRERQNAAIYEADLTILTSEKENLLLDGEYELSMNRTCSESSDGRRNATWEAIDGGREVKVLSTMNHCPLLKFKLMWTQNKKPGPLTTGMSDENMQSNSCQEPEAKRIRRTNQQSEDDHSSENIITTESPPVFPVDQVEYRKRGLNLGAKKRDRQRGHQHDGNGLQDDNALVYYQFTYNSETQQQTEARYDLDCPWCLLDCSTVYGLLKHLKLSHPRFNFSYSAQSESSWIEVSVNECYDGSFCGNPQFIFAQPGMTFSRRGPVRRVQATETLVYRPRKECRVKNIDLNELLEKEENETLASAHYSAGHHRLYFHSGTTLPIRPCEFDYDSEEEADPDWLRDHIKKMLDEFTDVNEGEKPIMKLWNLYIMKHKCVADIQMSSSCQDFIERYASLIVRHNLRNNLLLHLVTLVDFGVIKTSSLLALMKHFDKIAQRTPREEKAFHKKDFRHELDILNEEAKETSLSTDLLMKEQICDQEEEALGSFSSRPKQVATSQSPVKLYDSDKSSHLSQLQKIIEDGLRPKKSDNKENIN